jgi:NADH-quinone oxidoreductase subunit M
LIQVTPRFAFFMSLALLAGMGIPGTIGFVSELHAMIGGFERWGILIVLVSLGVMISAAYAVRTIGRLFTGPVRADMREVQDLQRVELLAAGTLVVGIIFYGVYPFAIMQLMTASVSQLSTLFVGL